MTQWRRLRLWFLWALIVALVAATALWLYSALPGDGSESPLPAPLGSAMSPLPTPTSARIAALPPSRTGAGAALLWVLSGVALALGIAFVVLRWYLRAV